MPLLPGKGGQAIVIFLRAMDLGKVKTRLAASVGDQKALDIYRYLVNHTLHVCKQSPAAKLLYFYPEIESQPGLDDELHSYHLQHGDSLGDRMIDAIRNSSKLYDQILVIGTDCPYLQPKDFTKAFESLKTHDMVIGPSEDGGYYLIGMNTLHKNLFIGIDWSTDQVLDQTLEKASAHSLSTYILRTLSDVDYEADWIQFKESVSGARSLDLP